MGHFARIAIILIILCGFAVGAYAWEVEYDASTGLFPTEASPVWQINYYGATTSIIDGVLYIGNSVNYYREKGAISTGVPVTIETRMCMPSTTYGSANLTIETYGNYIGINIIRNSIATIDRYNQLHIFRQDFTTFRTISLAYDGTGGANIWVDNQFAFSWATPDWLPSPTTGYPIGVKFGSYTSASYWQYVSYSKEYLPVPEPSSLTALAFGLVPIGAVAMRRRQKQARRKMSRAI